MSRAARFLLSEILWKLCPIRFCVSKGFLKIPLRQRRVSNRNFLFVQTQGRAKNKNFLLPWGERQAPNKKLLLAQTQSLPSNENFLPAQEKFPRAAECRCSSKRNFCERRSAVACPERISTSGGVPLLVQKEFRRTADCRCSSKRNFGGRRNAVPCPSTKSAKTRVRAPLCYSPFIELSSQS